VGKLNYIKLFSVPYEGLPLLELPTPEIIFNKTYGFGYSLETPNSYLDLISRITNYGLDQLLLTPDDYKGILANSINNYIPISLTFNEEIDEEEMQNIASILINKDISRLSKKLNKLVQDNIYPEKLILRKIETGSKINIYNNGVVYFEETNDMSLVGELFQNA
jgi:hypothetical protein